MFLSVMCNFYGVLFQGDYDPTKTKVLHFAMNPTALAQKLYNVCFICYV